jgi:hypothetical protein
VNTGDNVTSFTPTFENGGYWKYYKDLEGQFENYLEQIPYFIGNEKAYSFRLASLILSIGAHIDSAFKEIIKFSEFQEKLPDISKNNRASIIDYYPIVLEYKLSKRKVMFKRLPEPEAVMPFQNFLKIDDKFETPSWWQAYNKIKHHFSDNFQQANLQNTRDALSGAFLLNAIHTPAYIRLVRDRVIKPQRDGTGAGVFSFKGGPQLDENLKKWAKEDKLLGVVETSLFFFEYRNNRVN